MVLDPEGAAVAMRVRRRAGVVATLVAATLAVPPVETASAAHAIDRTDRDAVVAAYTDELLPALQTPVTFVPGDAPDVATCSPGTESAASLAATMTAVNFYRSLVGLPAVTNHAPWNAKAQAAALISQANDELSHNPDNTWTCYSAHGLEGASRSNLGLGSTAARSVAGFMYDAGDHNFGVGHRRWILYPLSTRMGSGSTQDANALFVLDDNDGWGVRPDATATPWVAWPPSGYVPWEVISTADTTTTLFRWSLSSNAHPDADYSAATVAMTYGSEDLDVTLEPLDVGGAGDETLVWNARRVSGRRFAIETDAAFTITVSGVKDGAGVTLPPYTYTVDAIRAVPDTTGPMPAGFDWDGIKGGVLQATMRWHLPWDDDFRHTDLRIAKGLTAPTRTTGSRVCLKARPARTCTATGLQQGAHYTFATFAYDYAGNHSARSTFTIHGSTPTIAVRPATVAPGTSVAIRGSLYDGTPASNSVLPGERVHLSYRRRLSNGTWGSWVADGSVLTTNTPTVFGSYIFRRSVPRTTQFRVTFVGTTFYVGSRSVLRTVTVS